MSGDSAVEAYEAAQRLITEAIHLLRAHVRDHTRACQCAVAIADDYRNIGAHVRVEQSIDAAGRAANQH